MPYTEEYNQLMHELFAEVGEGSRVMNPTTVVRGGNVKIGRNVVVMNNSLFMAAVGITIEDEVLTADIQKSIHNEKKAVNISLECKKMCIFASKVGGIMCLAHQKVGTKT